MGIFTDFLFGEPPKMQPAGDYEKALVEQGVKQWNDFVARYADLPNKIMQRADSRQMAPRVRGEVVAGLTLGQRDRPASLRNALSSVDAMLQSGVTRGTGVVNANLAVSERTRQQALDLVRALRGQAMKGTESLSGLARNVIQKTAAEDALRRTRAEFVPSLVGAGVGVASGLAINGRLKNPFARNGGT